MIQKSKIVKKHLTNKSWKLSNVNVWFRPNMSNSIYTKMQNLSLLRQLFALYLHEMLEWEFKVKKHISILEFAGDWNKLRWESCLYRHSWKKYLTKSKKKICKIDNIRKLWYLLFRNFWSLLSKIQFYMGGWSLSCFSTLFWDSSNISYFLKILNVKLFKTS